MAWNAEIASNRIKKLKSIFSDDDSSDNHRSLQESDLHLNIKARQTGERSLFLRDLGSSQSRIVNGVHIYAKLLDYDNVLMENGRETEQSHQQLLAFLNLHYATADRVIQNMGAVRVDYHGGRLHAVIVEPLGNEYERIAAAVQLCILLETISKQANEFYGGNKLGSRMRFGIDSGKCVVISRASIRLDRSSRGEHEPLFLGSAANHAAKLAEKNDNEGIYLSNHAQSILLKQPVVSSNTILNIRESEFDLLSINNDVNSRTNRIMSAWDNDYHETRFKKLSANDFKFLPHTPPLSDVKFSELMPSNSIRMQLCSLFADIDGFTNYVDDSINSGNVREALLDIQVIRSELGLVLKKDFGGKKVRFIGDCIHGIIACGTAAQIDERATVNGALLCSGGLRSSFELCQKELPSTRELGLAIGIDLGMVPISRVGLRGKDSIRVASAKTVSISESQQQTCKGNETAIGNNVFEKLSLNVKSYFNNPDRKCINLTHAILLTLLTPASPAIASSDDSNIDGDSLSPQTENLPPFRAHMRLS